MAKLVILKSFMDSYYDNMIEKSTSHKYIRRVPKSNGKGYNYFYPEDFKKPLKALLSFFGMKEDKIDKAYENNNINQAYGVTKQSFAQHVLEYLTNRKTWNIFFANKANRDRYKTPEKPVKETEKVTVSEKEIVGGKTKEKLTVEEKETKEKNFKSTWNRSLMRKIYSMYNSVPEDKAENNPGIDTIKVGDSVSYNGRVGKVTKDFENGMMFVNFDNGGMGRFPVKELQKMNPTANEVTETATENAVEQNVNGTNEAVQEEVTETVKEPVEKPGFNKTEKAVITVLYEKYKEQLKDKYPDSDILNIKIGSKIIEDYPELDAHGDVRRTMMNVRGLVFDKKLLPDVVKFINDKNVKGENPLEEHENRSQAMMGNQNARKYGNLSDEANEVIAKQNLNVNEEGVVQPSVEESQASAEFWNRNKAKNYRFQKDQYGNTYMIMDGLDGYFYDKDGKRVDGAEMVHERTYHDEYIPQEPHITIRHNGGMHEYIYLTPDMKADLELGNTEYQPVDSTYVKPEKDSIREDYINLQNEKTQEKLKSKTYQMNKLYDMAKKTGIQVMEYTGGMMSNHGKITHVVLPIGVKDQNSREGMFIDKTDKVLVDYAKYLSENIEPTEKVEVKDELEKWQKNFLTAAFMALKKEDPTMADIWYIEKLQQKVPQLANKVKNWSEIINNPDWNMTAEDIQKVRDFANGEDTKTDEKAESTENNEPSEITEENLEIRNDGLTQEEANSLEYYVQDAGYTYINDKLRGVDETPMEQNHKEAIKNIDNVIARNTVKEKTLYRGIGGNVFFPEMNPYEHRLMELYFTNKAAYDSLPNDNWFDGVKYTNAKDNVEKYIKEINGKIFTDKGFVSTSKNIKDTNVFTDSHKNPVIVEFENIPENTHGVDLSQFKEGREFNAENEVLLHRDLNYKITGVKSFGGKVVLTAEIIPESEEEKRQNRSEAMMGNDNAAGERAKKPQTEKAMKKEEKKLEKARVDAGLPKPGMFERTSTIDDSTWDPNSKNYRFRDTGYIAGARKEQAALFITRSAKEGVRVNAKEIDWTGIEENPRTAEKLIVKSNIFGDVDWNGLKDKGMSGSAAFLIDRIYASAGAKPSENNADARHNYVIALNGLRDRFEDCKTVDDVLETLNEIQDEIKGEYVEIKESEKYKNLKEQMKAKRDVAWAKKDELNALSENARKTYDVEYQKIVEKYIEKGKKEKKIHWNARVSRYNIPKEYEDAFGNETKDLWKKAYAPWEKAVADFKNELKANGVKDEEFFEESLYNPSAPKHEIGWYDLWKLMPEMKEYRRLGKELDDYVEGAKIVVAKKNPLLEAWKSLGSKFLDIKSSNTFAQHRYDARKGKYDDWDWLEKDVKVREKKQSKQKKLFNLLVAETIERKGGRNVDISSTADLKKAFNLRDVQSGNWVLKDPESAEFHVRNAARALADLADITGIPDDKISLNGRLAMAFGARGTGNAGGSTAMAHYESVERVINLTKFKGGGCLGHEWFHAFDNLITCAMNGDNTSDIFLTNRYSNLTPATKSLVLEYLKYKDATDYMGTYRRGQIARKLKAKNFDVAELNKPQSGLQIKVQNAFDELVKAMTEGDSTIKSAVVYSKKDYNDMLFNFKEEKLKQWRDYDKIYSRSKPTMQVAIADAGSLDNAVKMLNERYGNISDPKTLRQKNEWVRLAAAYYDRQPDGNEMGLPLLVDSGKRGSQYLADAFDLDENGAKSKDYWSSTHEMAARAFSAYIEDTLKEQGRLNDYLSYAANNSFYDDGRPYPEGEERKKINAAFKKLFEVIKENNAIEKAVAIVDAPDFIIKNGRFLIRK